MTSQPIDWWHRIHDLATNLSWASFEAINKLTIVQLLCLYSEAAPGSPSRARTYEEYEEMLARSRAEQEDWGRG